MMTSLLVIETSVTICRIILDRIIQSYTFLNEVKHFQYKLNSGQKHGQGERKGAGDGWVSKMQVISFFDCLFSYLNPLSFKSVKHLISPYNITTWINHKAQENKRKDHELKKLLIAEQILFVSASGIVYSAENMHTDIKV